MSTQAPGRLARGLLLAAAVATVVAVTVVNVAVWTTPHAARARAVVGMGTVLVFVWCVLGGALQWHWRERLCAQFARVPMWLGCTGLALVEEAVAVASTNLAPLFGVTPAEAFITPSTNYLHTVGLHSVVVFVPMFLVWDALVRRASFAPSEVMLLVGVNGAVAELFTFGEPNSMWFFIYGLMAWLPARAHAARAAQLPRPRARHVLAGLALPFLAAVPVALVAMAAHPRGLTDLGSP